MVPRLTLVSLFALTLGATASAQNLLVDENFEAGLPGDWQIAGTNPIYWHLAAPGECGAVTQMVAYNNGPGLCAYTTYSFSTAGTLATPYLQVTLNPPIEVSFDYRLDIDLQDTIELFMVGPEKDWWPEYPLALTQNFINDGNLHSASFTADGAHPALGDTFRLEWRFVGDTFGNQGFGMMVDNVRITQRPAATPFCFGDGSATPCPCGNEGAVGEGCAHSGGHGAFFESSGTASVALDELGFRGHQLVPGQSALLFQGVNQVNGGLGLLFGDGLRCAGGQVIRLGVEAAGVDGGALWGPGLAGTGGWSAGDTRHFQIWYRDPVGSSCANSFNLTHGTSVTFLP